MRQALRIAAWGLGAVVLLAMGLVVAALIAGNTAGGRTLIERITAQLTKGDVRISGLTGSFPTQIGADQLQLSDDEGVWLTADRISLRWSPLDFIAWHVKVESVHAARVDMMRLPVSHPSSRGGGGGVTVPEIDIGQFAVDAVVLEPQLVGTRASLSVRGGGHLESLDDARLNVVVHRLDGNGDYEVHLAFDPTRMEGTLKLEEPAGGPLEHLVQLPGLGALEVTASLAGPRAAEKIQLDARAGELQASVHGMLDLRERSANLDYSLASPELAPRPGLAWRHLDLQGSWTGSLRAPRAAGHFAIDSLQLPGGARLASLTASLAASAGLMTVDATAVGLDLPSVPPQLLQGSPLHLKGTVHLDDPARPLELTLDQRLFSLRVQAVTAGARSAAFGLTLPDVAPFAALAKQKEVRGRATLSGKLAESSGAIRVDVAGSAAFTGPRVWAGLLGRAARFQLGASLSGRSINIDRLTLTGSAIALSVSGSAQRATASAPGGVLRALRGRWSLDLPNLAALSPDVQGTFKMTGQFAGAPRSLGAEMQAASTLSVRGSPQGTLALNIQAHGLPSAPTAAIEARGSFAGSPVELDASLERGRADLYHLEIERTDWKSAHIDANVTAGTNLSQGTGSLHLRIGRLADLAPLLGKPLQGSVSSDLALSPDAGRTHVQLRLDAQDVALGTASANAKLSGSGPIDALRLELAVQAHAQHGEPATLTTTALLDLPARVLALNEAAGGYHGQSVRLLSPSRIAFADGLRVSELRLGLRQAVLEVAGRVSPALDLHASLRGVDADLVNSFVPHLLAQGTLSADARLHGTASAPLGRATLELSAVRFADSAARGLPLLDLHGAAELMGTTAQVDAALRAGRDSQLELTGRAPLDARSTVDLKLSGKLNAAFANAFLEAHGERAAGTLTVDATVTGPAQAAEIGGSIQLSHGDLRDYAQGVHLDDIAAHIVGGQGILRIATLTAHAGSGELSMSGTLGVLQRGMPIDLTLTAKNAQPITNDILTANLNANMRVRGNLRERMQIDGAIHLNRTLIGIPNSLPPNVQVLNVIRPGQAPPAPAQHRLVIALSISVDAPREILVQGRGLNAELGGEVRISGTTQEPRVSGGFQLIRGTFSLASSQLSFTMGDVSFNGAGLRQRIDPTLDFTAQATAADATVTLHITGFADSPQFSLSSSPPLPQDEILARLLFGETASQLTAVQLAETGAALVSLTGVGGGGLNPLTKVQKALGLNVLTVGSAPNTGTSPNQNTGASVTAGRYVSSRVFVAATQSTTGVSQLQVDVDLTKHLKLQTRLGNGTATAQGVTPESDPGSSIGLSYQFEY